MTELLVIPGGFRVAGFDITRSGSRWKTEALKPDPNYQALVMHWASLEIARRYVKSRPDERYTHPPGTVGGSRSVRFISLEQQKLVKALRLLEQQLRHETERTDDELQNDLLGTLDPALDRVEITVNRGPSWLSKE